MEERDGEEEVEERGDQAGKSGGDEYHGRE